ncbi:helix-turn-helix transcriptional regulator [Streptomyces sp. NPDC079167]|uniref:helix-turn-helix domain-containing protein n=1 Tax=Streptomyces sp. NPDC079167 TaxID=3154513 RepID=UPI00341F04A3
MPAPKKLDPTQSLEALYGSMLRKLRMKAGWTQRELGNMIPIAHSRIAQFELGNETPVFDVAEALDRLLKADGDLMDLWQHVVRTPIPNWAIRYVNLEPKATKIRKYAAHSVPGLLQTEGYARGLLSVARPSVGDGLDKLLAARMARQQILGRSKPPVLWAVLDEAVLHRVVEQPSVMSAQLKHLLDVAESRNEITLQVLPFSAGAHPLLDGSATVLSFASRADVAYLEGSHSGELIEHGVAVAEYALAFDYLLSLALSPRASATMIRSVLEDLNRDARPPGRSARRRLAQVQLQQHAGRRLRGSR